MKRLNEARCDLSRRQSIRWIRTLIVSKFYIRLALRTFQKLILYSFQYFFSILSPDTVDVKRCTNVDDVSASLSIYFLRFSLFFFSIFCFSIFFLLFLRFLRRCFFQLRSLQLNNERLNLKFWWKILRQLEFPLIFGSFFVFHIFFFGGIKRNSPGGSDLSIFIHSFKYESLFCVL